MRFKRVSKMNIEAVGIKVTKGKKIRRQKEKGVW